MSRSLLSCVALAVMALASTTASAQIANGSFEGGSLAGWTASGTGQVLSIQNTNVRNGGAAAPMPAVPDGTYFAALSTGPGARVAGGALIDGNSTNDFDPAVLTGSLTYSGRPAVLIFDWNFGSAEPSQGTPYDDIFDVRINGVVVFSGSTTVTSNNISTYPDVPNGASVNWTLNAGILNGTAITRGFGAWRRTCVPIAAATTGTYTLPVAFRVADQADNTVDTVLLVDNVRVAGACDISPALDITQITNTSGSVVEQKTGGFIVRPVQSRLAAINRDGGTVQAFLSTANLTGDNPNALEQVFIRSGTTVSRITGLPISAGGQIQSVNVSDNGTWVVVAARPTSADNFEIYRYNRGGVGTLFQVTNTTGCSNTNPVINDAGTQIAFESTCAALTGLGTTRRVVRAVMTAAAVPPSVTATALPAVAGACTSRNPTITTTGFYIGMETTCTAPGRSNADGNTELVVFASGAAWNQAVATAANWRQVTTTTGAVTNFSLSLNDTTGNWNTLEGALISSGNLTGANADGSTEVFRWVGNNTSANNGTLTAVTTNAVTGDYYTQVFLVGASDYFSFERLNATNGIIEIGEGLSTTAGGAITVVAAGGTFLGLGVAETGTRVIVPFVAAEDILFGQNPDENYELFIGGVTK